ncbi:MAG: S41 family peptidase [Patescibacteria group bacterium]
MKIRFQTIINFLTGFLLLALGVVLGYRYANTGSLPLGIKLPFVHSESQNRTTSLSKLTGELSGQSVSKDIDFGIFWEVWNLLERDYLEQDKIVTEDMVDGAVFGLTQSLGDPYTIYLSPKANQRSAEDLSSSFYGIGIELGYIDNNLAVVAPIKGTPAAQVGIEAGDLILHVKDPSVGLDEDTNGWTLQEAVDHIRGKKGSEIILTLWRKDKGEPFEVRVTRGEIVVESVELEFPEVNGQKVAHLRVIRFGERTFDEWDKAVQEIIQNRSQIKGIVLDFRNNPGGYFDRSIEIASDFIKSGKVVTQQGRYTKQEYKSNGKARLTGMPLVILVNRGSASAAEIVAGALRDDVGAKLVGEKTFGKGTVQERRELSNGGGLHITIAKWMLPKGDWIHHEGIPVDVEVKDDPETDKDEVLERAVRELK